MIALSGVRNSCDMLARKLDLVRLASSAASRAFSVDGELGFALLHFGDVRIDRDNTARCVVVR